MNIEIYYTDTESLLIRNSLLWKLAMKKSYRSIIILLTLGAAMLIIGLSEIFLLNSDKNGSANLNFSLSFGLGLILLSLIYRLHLWIEKKNYFEAIKLFIKRARESNTTGTKITLNSESIKLSNFEESYESNWTAFLFYSISHGYVVLYKQQNIPSYLVELAKLNDSEQREFLSFLQTKSIQQKN